MAIDRHERGRCGEDLAAHFLALQGYRILERNRRWADVEVDIVARDRSLLVVVEVKLRCDALGAAADAVQAVQRLRLRRAASLLLERHAWAEAVRLDLVTIDWRGRFLQIEHHVGVL